MPTENEPPPFAVLPVPPTPPTVDEHDVDGEGRVRNLTRFEKSLRGQLAAARADADKAKTDADARVAAAMAERDGAVAAERKASGLRTAKAELRALAVAAGISDPDVIGLADMSGLVVADDGTVTGVAAVLEAFQAAKPHFFAPGSGVDTGTTSKPNQPPPPAGTKAKQASDMTPEEYAAEKRRLTGRR